MKKHRLQNILRNAILAALIIVLSTEPVLVAAKTLQEDPQDQSIDLVLQGGDRYLDSISSATVESIKLINFISVVQNTQLDQLNEAYIEDVIARALGIAEQSSIALGAADDMADGIEQIGDNLPVGMDIAQTVSVGIPDKMRSDLIAQGIPSSQIDQINASASDLFIARQSAALGLPADLQADLLSYGFTQAQIDEIEFAIGQRGLVDNNLNTRLAQFRATQDELADARSSMLILAVQLLGYQIAVRQLNGLQPRAATDAELQALAEDELRILIHAAHLNAMWGNDPSAEIGEGDWWFIEHFAERAGDRLQTLIVETQNRGLVADLFIIRQMKMLAVSARSGDADYAKVELDALTALLAHQLNAVAYYQQHASPGLPELALARLAIMPSMRERVEWPVSDVYVKNVKLTSLILLDTANVQNLASIGVFDESNETNNLAGTLFLAGLPFFEGLDISILQPSLQILSAAPIPNMSFDWLLAILTGQTDNLALLTANVVLSIIPIIGAIPDIISLFYDPSTFVKAASIFGIIGSIGDVTALLGLEPVSIGSFAGDTAAAVIKYLFKLSDFEFRMILDKGLDILQNFEVVKGLMKTALLKFGGSLGNSWNAIEAAIRSLSVWDDFVAFVRRAGADTLIELGFDEGSALAGRILRGGTSLGDEALLAVDNVGDKIAKVGVSLSDEGMDGVGVLAKNVDPEDVTKFSDELLAICGAAGYAPGHAKLARPLFRASSDCVNRVMDIVGRLDDTAKAGLNKLCKSIGGKDMATLAKKYSEQGLEDAFKKTLSLSADSKFANWTSKASSETLDELIFYTSKNGEYVSERLLNRLCATDCSKMIFDEQFQRILNRLSADDELSLILNSSENDDLYNGLLKAIRTAEAPNIKPVYADGWNFQIERAREYYKNGIGGGLSGFESKDEFANNLDILLADGTIVEVKHWSKGYFYNNLDDLADQISRQASSGSDVIVEFANRGGDSVTDEMIQKYLIPKLESLGVNTSLIDFNTFQ